MVLAPDQECPKGVTGIGPRHWYEGLRRPRLLHISDFVGLLDAIVVCFWALELGWTLWALAIQASRTTLEY